MDNIVVWIPAEKVLFPGCLVKEVNAKGLGNTVDGDLKAYPRTIENLLQKFPDAKIVIPGHGAFGGTELITHMKELLKM
jgi:metallo-beta-lactamase class B